MNEPEKELRTRCEALSEGTGFDKPGSPLIAASHEAREFARSLRARYGDHLTRMQLLRVARAFTAELIPRRKPGRKPKAQVTAAVLDFQRGIRGDTLFAQHIGRWEKMSHWRRMAQSRALMESIRTRLRRQREH